ncbi:MAG: hemerythrin domain-containing protein, partial [Candidatus Taylorbacteria bacterium]
VTVSLGVVCEQCRPDGSVEEVIAKADKLLYQAKSSGRNRLEFVAPRDIVALSGGKTRGTFLNIVWKDDFSCGNPLLDFQHLSLFQTANELLDAVLSDRPAADVSLVIERLLAESRQHFQDEQEILEAVGFSGAKQHAAEHSLLLNKGLELAERLNASSLSTDEIIRFLVYDVVVVHLLGADHEFFPYLRAVAAEKHPRVGVIPSEA